MGNTKRISNLEHRVAALEARTAQEAPADPIVTEPKTGQKFRLSEVAPNYAETRADTPPAPEPEDFGAVVAEVCRDLEKMRNHAVWVDAMDAKKIDVMIDRLASANGQTLDDLPEDGGITG